MPIYDFLNLEIYSSKSTHTHTLIQTHMQPNSLITQTNCEQSNNFSLFPKFGIMTCITKEKPQTFIWKLTDFIFAFLEGIPPEFGKNLSWW